MVRPKVEARAPTVRAARSDRAHALASARIRARDALDAVVLTAPSTPECFPSPYGTVEEYTWRPDDGIEAADFLKPWYSRDELQGKQAPIVLTVVVLPTGRRPWTLADESPSLGAKERGLLGARDFRNGEVVGLMDGHRIGEFRSDKCHEYKTAIKKNMRDAVSRRFAFQVPAKGGRVVLCGCAARAP